MWRLVILLNLAACCPAVTGLAETVAEPNKTPVSDFLTPDGRFDIEAARHAGFEGSLDLDGFDIGFDPHTGEPRLSTASSVSSPNDDPDDVY